MITLSVYDFNLSAGYNRQYSKLSIDTGLQKGMSIVSIIMFDTLEKILNI